MDLTLPFGTYTLTIHYDPANKKGAVIDVDAFVVTLPDSFEPPPITHSGGWSLIKKGLTGVSAMQITVISPTHAMIFEKVEHNYASIGGHPAWGVLYNLNTDEISPFPLQSNSFCASGSFLSNGTLVSIGGNPAAVIPSSPNAYHDVDGRQSIRIVEPCLSPDATDCNVLDLVDGSPIERWYPTVLRVTDGSGLIIGGGTENVFMNNITINQPSVSFFPSRPTSPISFDFPFLNRTLNANLFVHAFSLPNKRAFVISNTQSIFFDWGASPPHEEATEYTLPNGVRVTYPMAGTALLLPLSSQNNYTSRIIVCGGSKAFDRLCNFQYSAQFPGSNQCSTIEIKRDGTTTGWKLDDPMPEARVMPDGIMLPTGEIVIVNGAGTGYSGFASVIDPVGLSNADHPTLSPILYSPDKAPGKRFTQLTVRSDVPRMYHSVATLTPNGNIMIAGSNPNPDRLLVKYPTEYRVEWLNPPYMTADRPTYSGLPKVIGFESKFTLKVNIPKGLDQSKMKGAQCRWYTYCLYERLIFFFFFFTSLVSLMDLGFSTHSMHANSRIVYLDSTLSGSTLTVTAPPDAGVYPPGPGYVFVVVDGVPSKADVTLIGDGKAPVAH